ncbi:MAG: response regulator transcription factor [Chloroflexota bacterium]
MRILLADDNPEVRTALRLILEHQPGHQLLAEADNVVRLLNLTTQYCPEVVLLDTELEGLKPCRDDRSLRELLETLKLLCPNLMIAALCSGQITGKEAWIEQVNAVFCKSDPPDSLLNWLQNPVSPN